MSTNIPDNLMANVEKDLRKHIKDKQRKRHMYKGAATAAVIFFVILPGSVFAYDQYNHSIMYKQEIDLARENKNITEVNQSFKYKDVEFKIKEIVADYTGMEFIYDVSDPKYSISDVSFGDKDNKSFEAWGYSNPDSSIKSNEKSFGISMDNTVANYMHSNPITITINNIKFNNKESDNPLDKLRSLFNHNDELKVDWNLKMQVPMQQIKVILVNKEYSLDIGTLKINSFKVGVLKSILDYSFVPKDKTISLIHPFFSLRLDNEYINSNGSNDHGTNGGSTGVNISNPSFNFASGPGEIYGVQEFKSIYYKNIDKIGIKLINIHATYSFKDSKTYTLDKNNLPMEFDFKGEKFKITSMKERDDSTEYMVEYNKTNRLYSELYFYFSEGNETSFEPNNENIQYRDQPLKDKTYSSLVKKVPNLKDIEKNFKNLQDVAISTKITTKSKISESGTVDFKIDSATKNLIYNEEEVIVHK